MKCSWDSQPSLLLMVRSTEQRVQTHKPLPQNSWRARGEPNPGMPWGVPAAGGQGQSGAGRGGKAPPAVSRGWRPLQAAPGRASAASAAAARRCQRHGVRRRARGKAGGRPPARSPRPGPRMQPSPWSGGGGSRSSRGPPGSGCCSRGTGCSPSSPPSCSTPWRR